MEGYDQAMANPGQYSIDLTHQKALVLQLSMKASLTLILVESCNDLSLHHSQKKNHRLEKARTPLSRILIF